QLEVGLALVAVLELPAAIVAPRASDDVDRLGEARVARRLDGLEVIERAQDIVVPARREGEAKEDRLDDRAGAMGAEEPMHQEELTAATLGSPHGADFAPAMQIVMSQPLQDTDGRVDRRMSCAMVPLAVPAAVGHLLIEEMVGKGVET